MHSHIRVIFSVTNLWHAQSVIVFFFSFTGILLDHEALLHNCAPEDTRGEGEDSGI